LKKKKIENREGVGEVHFSQSFVAN